MLVPGIITVAAFAFLACWNEFLFSLMFLNDPAKYKVPIRLLKIYLIFVTAF